MNKKKKIYLFIAGILLISITVFIVLLFRNQSKFKAYEKYLLTVQISTNKNGETIYKKLKIYDDGDYIIINSQNTEDFSYLIGNKLYYKLEGINYVVNINDSYKDLQSLLLKLKKSDKIKTENKKEYYSALLSANVFNKLLKCLFIKGQTSLSGVITFTTEDNKISDVDFSITDIANYDIINISLDYNDLGKDFKIDKIYIDKINEELFADKNSLVSTQKNIYEIG